MRTNLLTSLSDNIRVDPEKCIYCGVCVETCILDNLRLQLAPCRQGCPLGLNCHGYVRLIARGKIDQALALVRERTPFAGILGRVCSAPCEKRCTREELGDGAIAIRALKRFLADHVDATAPDLGVPQEHAERVAVIGSGPGGMMAAWDLRKQGYAVEIFEAASRPGGLLAHGIPAFRLSDRVLVHEYGYLAALGVQTHFNTAVGRDVSLAELLARFDAIFLATGAGAAVRLGLPGERAAGVYDGLAFLRAARGGGGSLLVGPEVLVIGGGNVAVDAARAALRLGGVRVRLVCLELRAEMPAFGWEIDEAIAEGIELVERWGPARFVIKDDRVREVEFAPCTQVFDASGAFNPCLDQDERRTFVADTVIVAVGQRPALEFLAGSGLALANGWIAADPVTCRTSIDGVFAGGDVATGPQSVVHAMAAGRAAAESIARYLRGEDVAYGRDYTGPYVTDFRVDPVAAAPAPRITLPRGPGAAPRSWAELEGPLSSAQATAEASRCLSCGLPEGHYRTCWFCLPCEVECPEQALWVDVPYLLR